MKNFRILISRPHCPPMDDVPMTYDGEQLRYDDAPYALAAHAEALETARIIGNAQLFLEWSMAAIAAAALPYAADFDYYEPAVTFTVSDDDNRIKFVCTITADYEEQIA